MEERIGANGMPIPAKPAAEKAPEENTKVVENDVEEGNVSEDNE
tara:strand:+ start:424 stop:555 length:132 start_codon:yes stop_codon:yes gene_type:complete